MAPWFLPRGVSVLPPAWGLLSLQASAPSIAFYEELVEGKSRHWGTNRQNLSIREYVRC